MDVARMARRGADLCHAVAEGHEVMPEVLRLLADGVGTDMVSWSCIQLNGTGTQLLQHGRGPLEQPGMAEWERLLPTHPYATHLITDPAPRTRLTDVVDLVQFQRSEVYQVLLAPTGDRYQAAFVLDRSPEELTLLSLWRVRRDFTDEEVAPVERLAAALAASARVRDNLEALRGMAEADPATPLTPRQTQVVALVALGLTNEQAARRLGLSPRTVRKHLESLFARTGATSRTELAVLWRESVRTGTPLGPLR
ncbi:response regulator transcription factor [Ornithinimicrobium sp. W1679]|uniref:helix-turn-helix transcriptional regulator n=1 Tax=Ornithinimicrobium sp. W1679 TaxID=3418770 RepID=UPI003CE92715